MAPRSSKSSRQTHAAWSIGTWRDVKETKSCDRVWIRNHGGRADRTIDGVSTGAEVDEIVAAASSRGVAYKE
jgi:hypothetical protein